MIRHLRAVDFRCLGQLGIELPAAGAVFTGDNAQGKTSVLEAVCVLMRLQSPRSHRMAPLARVGGPGGFGLAADLAGEARRVRWAPGTGLGCEVDGERSPGQADYLAGGGLIVWMGNEDLELVRGSGEVRRRYLDFLGCQHDAAYRKALGRYRRALRAKNLLLKDPRPREGEIASYESILVENGDLLTAIRAQLVARLQPEAAHFQNEIAGREEALEVDYRPAGGLGLARAFEQARDKERRQRQCLVGPHRDDLKLRINGLEAGGFASEGQQRTLALALKLAQGRVLEEGRERKPLWLIDDIFGELDRGRRHAVLRSLPTASQKWITTTRLDWLQGTEGLEGMARFEVTAGQVGKA